MFLVRTDPAIALVLWFTPEAVLGYHVFAPHATGLLRAPRRFATSAPEVWLTIDDGPDPVDTPRILALLAAEQQRATFFVIGRHALAHPDLIRAIVADGHEIGHHTHTHPLGSFWCASPRRLRRELDHALAALHSLGVTPTRFRAPANHKHPWLARELKARVLAPVDWTTRGLETHSRTPERVAERALRGLAPGNIILLHEGPRVPTAIRVHAVQLVLEHLRARGFRCVIPTTAQLIGPANF